MAASKKTTPTTTKKNTDLIFVPLQAVTQLILKDEAGEEYYLRHDLRGKFTLMPLEDLKPEDLPPFVS